MQIDYIETNASWYTDEKKASEYLSLLLSADVSCLLISLDPFHNEFVALDKVKSLVECCKKAGMRTFIWQSQFERPVSGFDSSSTHTLAEYINRYGNDFISSVINSYGLTFNGRALKLADMIYSPHQAEYWLNDRNGDSCNRITSPHHFHIDVNGSYIPPGCIGFKININDLQKTLSKEKYANFLCVVNGGIKALYDRAVSLGFVPKTDGYSHKCALCFDIKKYILSKTSSADLGPCDFFDEY